MGRPENTPNAPRITSPMSVLAWAILNGPEEGKPLACTALAMLVSEAGEEGDAVEGAEREPRAMGDRVPDARADQRSERQSQAEEDGR